MCDKIEINNVISITWLDGTTVTTGFVTDTIIDIRAFQEAKMRVNTSNVFIWRYRRNISSSKVSEGDSTYHQNIFATSGSRSNIMRLIVPSNKR